ncbi:hypothetical protein M0R45_034580 [Rubus argutus]|uniref:Uncharacterized protein n=1 Tax=Rubus argutus TaxID=59490 RepID=A0AAW1VUX1_RUBAR
MSKDGDSLVEAMEIEARNLWVNMLNDSFEAELEKEEGDWNSTTADLIDTLDEYETKLLSSGLGENESQYSADESNNGDEEFSSLECESDNDPLEDTNFKLENFLKDLPFPNSSVIQGIEEPMEKSLGLLQLEKLSEKEVEVPKDEEVEDHARNKFKAAAKQYRRRGGTCSSLRNTHHAQKFRKNLQLVGKLGEVPCSYEDGIDSPKCVQKKKLEG